MRCGEVGSDFQVRTDPSGCSAGGDPKDEARNQDLERKFCQQVEGWLLHQSKQDIRMASLWENIALRGKQRTWIRDEPNVPGVGRTLADESSFGHKQR